MVQANLVILMVFLFQALATYLTWLYWVQVKEYRYDRLFIFLKSPDGARELFLAPTLIKLVILPLGFFYTPIIFLYIAALLILDTSFCMLFLKKALRKPIFTQRIVRIILITSLLFIALIPIYKLDFWLFLFLSEIWLLLGLVVGTFLTGISAKRTLYKEKSIAQEKIKKYSPTVIAITGSYGKTTTKDFITQILSSEHKVLSTYKNQNTHFGIVRRINSELQKDHKFFIAEIGAYKKGEISQIASILNPSAVLISGIEPQHLELFGSFENLKRAKFEIVEALENNGLAFFNLTNPEVDTLVKWTKEKSQTVKIFTYAVGRKGKYNAFSQITTISTDGITFKITIGAKTHEIKTNISSPNLIENLTGAILIARNFGISWPNIAEVASRMILPEGTLTVFKTGANSTVIDDSYNSTPHGFAAALDLLRDTSGMKKIIITSGIIELGKESYNIHKTLGLQMDGLCDMVILRNNEFLPALREGITDTTKIKVITDSQKIITFLKKAVVDQSVILVEGKLPQVISYLKRI